MADSAGPPNTADVDTLQRRVAELEREQRRLRTESAILQDITGSLHFVDILQSITRRLGELFGLDRCSFFLTERRGHTARLVASFEDPAIRNNLVDLDRYPELKRALQSGETVFIPDAAADPHLKHIQGALTERGVKTITVVPLAWRGAVIGAMFLRTFRDGPTFSDSDLQFCQMVAELTARALRNAYRLERAEHRQAEASDKVRTANLERMALVAFLTRCLDAFARREGTHGEELLSTTAGRELDRLTEVALAVIEREAQGR